MHIYTTPSFMLNTSVVSKYIFLSKHVPFPHKTMARESHLPLLDQCTVMEFSDAACASSQFKIVITSLYKKHTLTTKSLLKNER